MKKIYQHFSLLVLVALVPIRTEAQCASSVTLGTSTNMFTLIRNGNHPIVVDKTLNMVVFIHRNDAATFGGNSGELRYDVSTNAGTTWTLNQGVLNPSSASYARYPNVAIYNPTNNVTPSNAYISYLAPTITTSTSAWNGVVTGVRQVNGGIPTETYNQNGIGLDQIPHSLVKGAPGVFWAIDPTTILATGYKIYRGVWNSTSNDIVWSLNYTATPPFNTSWTSAGQVVDYNIAFDPTGQTGYFSFLGHITGSAVNNAIYPILYKTTNGGVTWTGPIQVDLSNFSCITTNTTSGGFASTNVEHDLIVDANGNPHVIATVGSASNYIFNYSAWHRMYDITLKNGLWAAYDLGSVNAAPNTFGNTANIATQWLAPQAARSADGTKLFFTWTNNTNYTLGSPNALPDLFGKAFNVTTNSWTQTKNFTACNTALAGRMWFPHIATEALEPTASSWKLAGVYSQPTIANDLGSVANFFFLDNLTFSSSEFSVAVPPATVTIAQGPSLLYCPNTTVNINVTGAGQVIWSNSVTTNPLPVTSSSISTYSVIAQVGCLVGTASITVNTLSVSAAAVSNSICPGSAASFTAGGNAFTYSWSPGTQTGTNVSLFPTANTVTLTATGSSGCAIITTVAINVLSPPVISIAGTQTTCAGYVATHTATGAQSYLWSDGTSGSTFTMLAVSNTVIAVAGIGANSCTSSATASVVVNPSPIVNAVSASTAICPGNSLTFFGSGTAATYSWNGSATGPNLIVTPTISSTYTLAGSNNFGCISTKTLALTVYTLPTLSVTANRPGVCRGEKITLTASGASSYTWITQGVLTPSVLITPSSAQVYTYQVAMLSSDGCENTGTYVLTVSACTGLSENIGTSRIQLWPNPSSGSFQLLSGRSESLGIYNAVGQLVRTVDLKEEEVAEVKGLSAGVYFIRSSKDSGKGQRVLIQP